MQTSSQKFTYTPSDPNGNLIKRVEKATGKTTTYSYDAENQLISVISEQGSVISHKYDGLGRRIEKNVDGKITRYVYDNEDIILELDAQNSILAPYIHGPGIDEPIRMERNGEVYCYIPDALGNIRALVDTKGFIRQMYDYDSFGGIRVLDEEGRPISIKDAIQNPYTFTGREYDPESGLYYYRTRHYDPSLGRFLQEDPILSLHLSKNLHILSFSTFKIPSLIQKPEDLHPYVYAQNNPINYVDPTGYLSVPPPEVIGCLACMAAVYSGCLVGCQGAVDYWKCVDECVEEGLEFKGDSWSARWCKNLCDAASIPLLPDCFKLK
jgi:RHS repeat-associated protein